MADQDEGNLEVTLQTRVTKRASELLKDRAWADGVNPSTWIRREILRSLGLLPGPTGTGPTGTTTHKKRPARRRS
jgi:hypothetical protein